MSKSENENRPLSIWSAHEIGRTMAEGGESKQYLDLDLSLDAIKQGEEDRGNIYR